MPNTFQYITYISGEQMPLLNSVHVSICVLMFYNRKLNFKNLCHFLGKQRFS
jgi:hypothetical protein